MWIAIGVPSVPGRMGGAMAVVGWLDGYASPHFVGKYRLCGGVSYHGTAYPTSCPARYWQLVGYAQQTLRDATIERDADGTLMMSFTATLSEDGFLLTH